MRLLANENLHLEIMHGLQQSNFEVEYVPHIGLAGHKDREILDYSEKNSLVLISGDKDFGGLIEFGPLWGRGKVILLRYRTLNINRIVKNIVEVLRRERDFLTSEGSAVIVISDSGYRVHRPGKLTGLPRNRIR
jgi:predicted nuclease of predicted toxin-antitoxin system